jgi:hypothetical protein
VCDRLRLSERMVVLRGVLLLGAVRRSEALLSPRHAIPLSPVRPDDRRGDLG